MTRFNQLDARTQDVLDALMNNRDLFSTTLQDHTVLLQGLEKDIRQSVINSEAAIQIDLSNTIAHTKAVIKDEHRETRVIVREESDRIIQTNAVTVETMTARL